MSEQANMASRYEREIPEGYEARIEGSKVIFELKESEDERIRKWLIEMVEELRKANPTNAEHNGNCSEAIAYLEKQKERKPVMIQWTGKNLKEVIDFTGKSQKFGEWFKSWEDFENYVHSHGDILKLFCGDSSHYEVPVGAWIVKTPDGYNTPSRFRFIQKPAEWSEEDEKCIKDIIDCLKYLKKEDTERQYNGDRNVNPKRYANMIAKLKSLRPQFHWKPSERQLGALLTALGDEKKAGSDVATDLRNLHYDLKKYFKL